MIGWKRRNFLVGKFPVCGWVGKFTVCVDGWGSFQCVWVCWEVSRLRVGVCAEVSSVWVDVRKFPVYGWCVWGSF